MIARRQFLKLLGGAVAAVGIPLPALAGGLSARQLAMRRAARHWGLTVAQARQKFIRYRAIWAGWITLAAELKVHKPATLYGMDTSQLIRSIREGEEVWGLNPIELPS